MKLLGPENIKEITPYPPGKPIEELEREYGISGSIKLASNENPFGPSPAALKAMRSALENLHRYPDGSCYYLNRAVAEHLGVEAMSLYYHVANKEAILNGVVDAIVGEIAGEKAEPFAGFHRRPG